MKLRSRMTGVALVVTLSACGGLAACGSDDEKDSSSSDSTSDTSDSSKDDSADSGDSGDSGDKPSKDEVVDGYTKVITDTLGDSLPPEIVNDVVTCFVDELYDKASDQTLQAIADADATGVDPDDTQLFSDATTTCTQEIAGG